MKSLKPIGLFLIKCFGEGIKYGTVLAFGYGAIKAINKSVNDDIAKDNYNKGIKVGALMEQNRKLNEQVESE